MKDHDAYLEKFSAGHHPTINIYKKKLCALHFKNKLSILFTTFF